MKSNDIHASIELLSVGIGFIPKSSYSMSPTLLLHILNDVIINNKKRIIEFGSGISTIYLAKIIKDKNLDCVLYSIDEDDNWQSIIKTELENNSLESYVQFITAPLTNDEDEDEIWYNKTILIDSIDKKIKFDCIIVDAPSTKEDKNIRYWAIPFLLDNDLISKHYTVFVDDTFRESEASSVSKWGKLLPDSNIQDYKVYSTISNELNLVSRPVFQGHNYRLEWLINKK